jgi:hypothetical protein
VDLRFDRPVSGGDEARVDIIHLHGNLDVQVDYARADVEAVER